MFKTAVAENKEIILSQTILYTIIFFDIGITDYDTSLHFKNLLCSKCL